MREDHHRKRKYLAAAALGAGALLLASSGLADAPVKPHSAGNFHKGTLTIPLRRGAAVAWETFFPTLPSDCEGEITLKLTWDEEDNTVTAKLHGEHVFVPHPSIHRTEGVNFFPNPFSLEPKDFDNGRYQFWIISPARLITSYYDATTLDFLGTEFEFPTPPPNAIPQQFPGIKLFPSPFYEPDEDGNVDFEWNFAYDHCVRGDRPEFAHHMNTFPPTNLCLANPVRYDLSTTRPYLSFPLPASEALSFSEFLRNGLIFENTIEPPTYFTNPPLLANISTYSGATVVGGGIPRHWAFDLDAAFMNNAPPIKPFELAGTCADGFKETHIRNINFCGP
jgi:hypothetical protein